MDEIGVAGNLSVLLLLWSAAQHIIPPTKRSSAREIAA